MSEQVTVVRLRRIVAALPAEGDAGPLARLAARLATSCGAELSAVVVEDMVLARLAQLPMVRHLSMTSARSIPLTSDTLRLSLAASVNRMQAMMARLPEVSALHWSLHADRDDDGLPDVDTDDLMLVSMHVALPRSWDRPDDPQRASVAALVIDAERATRSIVVAHDGSPEGRRALSIAAQIAQPGRSHCRVLVPSDLSLQAEQSILETMHLANVVCELARRPRGDADTIAAEAREAEAGLILLPAAADTVRRLQSILGTSGAGGG